MTQIQSVLVLIAVVLLYGIVARLDDDEEKITRMPRQADESAACERGRDIATRAPLCARANPRAAAGDRHAAP